MSNLNSLLLSEEQQARYLALLAQRGIDHGAAAIIRPRPRESRTPLCSFQEPLWFIDRLTGGDTAHNVVYPMGLPEGDIDERALRRAIVRMMERHEILRTTFRQDEDMVVQVVHEQPQVVFDRVDLTPLPESAREPAGWALVDAEAAHRFDLDTGPLIKFTLLTVAPGKNVLIVSLHHIVCDTWSVAIIDREVRTHYDDIVRGKPWTLAPMALQFGDYCAWQRSAQGGPGEGQHLSYWMERLADAPRLQLPTDFPEPERRSHAASNSLVFIDEALLARVKEFAKAESVTLYMVLLTAFKVMLARHTGQTDIVVGTPHANRDHQQTTDLIGFTINSLVLRTDLGGEPDFRCAVQRVRATSLEAHEHQGIPFQTLVENLGAQGRSASLSRYSLFRAFFSVQNIRWADIELPQVNTGALHSKPRFTVPHPTTKYDIYMYLRERDGKVLGGLEYDVELFKPSRIERMIRHFLRILDQGVANPQTAIHRLAMLDGDESALAASLAGAGAAHASGGATRDIVSEFERSVERHADRIALVDGDRSLSYRALAEMVESMSAGLHARGIGPGDRVGLLADRSWRLVAATMAVLRSGAACFPLDFSAPAERTASALAAHDIGFLLHDAGADLPPQRRDGWIALESLEVAAGGRSSRVAVSAGQNAFVFMTSGSTGVPNAVVLTHGAVLHGQLPQTCPHPIGPGDRLLLNAPASSARLPGELLWPLLNGATVVMCRPAGHQDPEYLGTMLATHAITHVSLVPDVLAQVLDQNALSACPALSLVYCVGQNLEQSLVERFYRQCGAALYNSYAQTEACPVSFERCQPGAAAGRVPVGTAAPQTSVVLLGSHLEPVPMGVTGQIAVAGPCLAQAYLGKPALTAGKFVPNPFGPPGSRMYLTGDLGRWSEAGSLELSGRADQRVKIRGYRIDLGDIESALRALSGVGDAAVVAYAQQDAEPSIVAFVSPDNTAPAQAPARGVLGLVRALAGQASSPERPALFPQQLRAALQLRLPVYMLPGRIVVLDELPQGRTGKLDRAALLARVPGLPSEASAAGEPRNATDAALIEIWREVLGLPADRPIGIFDSFFALGGHSLLAIKIVKRVQSRLKVRIEIRAVFEAVTIAGLADLIRWEQSADSIDEAEADADAGAMTR